MKSCARPARRGPPTERERQNVAKLRLNALFAGSTEVRTAPASFSANLSLLKQDKVKGVRFETLARICEYLDCRPGDLLQFASEADAKKKLRRP